MPNNNHSNHDTFLGTAAVLGSLVSQNIGAAFAKHLFPVVGAQGLSALRIGFAALMLLLMYRSWKRPVPRSYYRGLLGYGLVLGLMNLLIYQSFQRIPVGIAVGLEVTGPLAVALLGSRRWSDFVWLALAVAGLLMLLPLRPEAALDPVGVAFAGGAGFCWALYIVFGKRVSASLGRDAVCWGMLIAAVAVVPAGVFEAGASLLDPQIVLAGLVIAALSSALPYSIEMSALRMLPSHVFGLVASTAPAIAALAAFFVLGERLDPLQWLALACIIAASGGCVFSAARARQKIVPGQVPSA